ncbi:MAG: sugar phosphate isomerase/epimerase [Clostridia bacterium]|nr:sugar phosphate isomerase/epimerase [Clostridia bacterium]
MKLPVAVQLYSVRDEMEKDFYGTIQKMKDLGYDGVEFAGLFGEEPSKIKAFCEEIGITPISAHVPYYDMLEDPEKVLADYAEIGCKYVAVPYLTEECRPGTDGFAATVEGIRKIGEAAKKLGIQLLYHNHDFEFVKIGEEYALDVLYSTIPADLLQTEIDTCWVNVAGVNPAEYIEKYAGRCPVVHLKDFKKSGDKLGKLYDLIGIDDEGGQEEEEDAFSFMPVGYGVQDMPAILAACEDAGANWVVVEQDSPAKGDTPLNSVKLSREYLRTLNW